MDDNSLNKRRPSHLRVLRTRYWSSSNRGISQAIRVVVGVVPRRRDQRWKSAALPLEERLGLWRAKWDCNDRRCDGEPAGKDWCLRLADTNARTRDEVLPSHSECRGMKRMTELTRQERVRHNDIGARVVAEQRANGAVAERSNNGKR